MSHYFGASKLLKMTEHVCLDGNSANLCEKEPIAVVALSDDGLNVCAVVGSAAVAQQQEATVGGGNGHQTEQDVNGSPNGKHDEPGEF